MAELVAYGPYVPYWRLERAAIAAALGSGSTKGSRAVCSFDEDSTSMAVEASRVAVASAPKDWRPDALIFATTSPAYQDKTNATAVHAALRLPVSVAAYDFVGAVRSGTGALRFAQSSSMSSLVVLADVRTGLAGGADEANGGDAAVAYAFGDGPGLVELIGEGSSTEEFLERWRTPGDLASSVWEERFGEIAYVPLAQAAVVDALKDAGTDVNEIDHLVVGGLHARAVRSLIASLGVRPEAVVDDLTATIGNTATAHAGLLLADVLDRAEVGHTILVVQMADGADAMVLRTTEALAAYRERRLTTVAEQISAGRSGLAYAKFLRWRGSLRFEPPRRPDPDSPAAPPSLRNEAWKFGFTASQCEACGTRHLPPARVCHRCRAVDQMSEVCLANVTGTIRTYTIDHLAFSLSPPVVTAVVDFDGGGRINAEMADVDPDDVQIGQRVKMTFRRLYTAPSGVHDYFWKAKLTRTGE
jgi:3-hydroxy-3-methylglutaryl CoA synthase